MIATPTLCVLLPIVVIVIIVRLNRCLAAGDGNGAYQTPCRENGCGIFDVRKTATATMVALTAREARHCFDMHNRVIHPSRMSVPRCIGKYPTPPPAGLLFFSFCRPRFFPMGTYSGRLAQNAQRTTSFRQDGGSTCPAPGPLPLGKPRGG